MYRDLIALLTCGLACAAESFESCATGAVSKLQTEYGPFGGGGGIFRVRIRAHSCTWNSMKHSPLRGEYFIGGQLPGSPGQSRRVASCLAKNNEISIVKQSVFFGKMYNLRFLSYGNSYTRTYSLLSFPSESLACT